MDIIVITVEPHEVLSALIADNKGYEETCIFELIAPRISNWAHFDSVSEYHNGQSRQRRIPQRTRTENKRTARSARKRGRESQDGNQVSLLTLK